MSCADRSDALDEFENCDPTVEIEQFGTCRRDLLPRLEWMSSLESLIITRRVWHGIGKDDYVAELLEWFMKRKTDTLPCLWVDDNSDSLWELPYREKLCAPLTTSFCVGEGDALASIDVNDQRFRHIHHLGGFSIARLDELPDLKYVRASLEDQQDLKVF